MRITLPRALALSAVLILPVACSGPGELPIAKSKVTASMSTPTPVEVTKETFGPRVLAALAAKSTYSVNAVLTTSVEEVRLAANIRTTDAGSDVAVLNGDPSTVRLGGTLYIKDDELTGSTKRPWARLNPRSKNPAELEALNIATAMTSVALGHQVIGGTPYSTEFKRGGQITVDDVETQEYIFTIDLGKAARAHALGELLGGRVSVNETTGLSLSVAIDDQDLPRRIQYTVTNNEGNGTNLLLLLRAFGENLPVSAPQAAQVGTVKGGKGQAA